VKLDELENALRTGLVEALEIAEDVRVMFMNRSL